MNKEQLILLVKDNSDDKELTSHRCRWIPPKKDK